MPSLQSLIKAMLIMGATCMTAFAEEESERSMTPRERHLLGKERASETAQLFEASTYTNTRSDSLPYRLLKPLDYDPLKKYPLVVCLSGSGGRGTDNLKQIAGCWPAQILAKPESRETYPCFVLVPQCPPGNSWGYSVDQNTREKWEEEEGRPWPPGVYSLVFDLIEQIESDYNIDLNRRYVTGQSLGGSGSWHFIITRPQMFAAAIPICGGADPSLGKSIAPIPVWAFHGAKDQAVPVYLSRDMIDAIEAAGGSPLYTEFPDAGHVSSLRAILG